MPRHIFIHKLRTINIGYEDTTARVCTTSRKYLIRTYLLRFDVDDADAVHSIARYNLSEYIKRPFLSIK